MNIQTNLPVYFKPLEENFHQRARHFNFVKEGIKARVVQWVDLRKSIYKG